MLHPLGGQRSKLNSDLYVTCSHHYK